MNSSQRSIKQMLNQAIGKRCWYVIVGGCTLPQFTLDLGEKIKRLQPIVNSALSKAASNFEGEASFFVRSSWRLERGNSVVVTSDDEERAIITGLNRLVGKSLEQIKVENLAWDLTLGFSKGWRLRVFADCAMHGYDTLRNWHYKMRGRGIYAGPGERIKVNHSEGSK